MAAPFTLIFMGIGQGGYMGLFNRRRRPARGGIGAGGVKTTLDREGTREDLAHLREFATTRAGVEFYLEPETTATDTTAVAVAADGEWTRRRVGSPAVVGKLARELRLPVYEAAVVGYPQRMRDWNARRKRESGL
jgi:hypothetical protein